MGFPGHEQGNPQQVSAAVGFAGFVQDVVQATSRAIHGLDLTERDAAVLGQCRELLQRLLSTDVSFPPPGERHLARTTAELFRRARVTQPDVREEFESGIRALDRVLAGDTDSAASHQLLALRARFLDIGQDNLDIMTRRDPDSEDSEGWSLSASSSS